MEPLIKEVERAFEYLFMTGFLIVIGKMTRGPLEEAGKTARMKWQNARYPLKKPKESEYHYALRYSKYLTEESKDKEEQNKFVNKKKKNILIKGFLICAIFALIGMESLGNPTCLVHDSDPRGGGCEQYADDGFTPTEEQRQAKFAYFLILFYAPVLVATITFEIT